MSAMLPRRMPRATIQRWIRILLDAGEVEMALQLRDELSRKEAA